MSASLNANPVRGQNVLNWLPIALGLMALYVPTFYFLATEYWNQDDHAYGPIILVVIAWLIWDSRKSLLDATGSTAIAIGLTLLMVGLLLYILGRSLRIPIFEVGALTPILGGVLLATRGWSAVRAMWFALLFVAFLIPLPGFFVDAVTLPLKQSVSVFAEQILYAVGYPIALNGVVLTIGQYQLLVADACSGLNSMFSLSALGLLYLYLMNHGSWLRNSLILASILPIAFCANIIRVLILVLVTYHFGDSAGQGFVHDFSGIVMFFAALVAMLAVDSMLAVIIKSRKRSL